MQALDDRVVVLKQRPFEIGRHSLIFTHIPKCGGASLHQTLRDIFGDAYQQFPERRGEAKPLPSLRAAGGHQTFSTNPLHERRTNLVYITVLRDPVDRFVSFYRHVISHPEHHLHTQHPKIKELPPLDFAKRLIDAGNFITLPVG